MEALALEIINKITPTTQSKYDHITEHNSESLLELLTSQDTANQELAKHLFTGICNSTAPEWRESFSYKKLEEQREDSQKLFGPLLMIANFLDEKKIDYDKEQILKKGLLNAQEYINFLGKCFSIYGCTTTINRSWFFENPIELKIQEHVKKLKKDESLDTLTYEIPELLKNLVTTKAQLQRIFMANEKVETLDMMDDTNSCKKLFIQQGQQHCLDWIKKIHIHTRKVPDIFDQIPNIEEISVINEKNSKRALSLPSTLFQCQNLKQLRAHRRPLHNIPDLIDLPKLEVLGVNITKYDKLPTGLYSLKHIKQLGFQHWETIDFGDFFQWFSKLRQLQLWWKDTKTIPDLSNLTTLEDLELKNYSCWVLPERIWKLKNLKELECIGCNIKQLPSTMAQLEKLELLNISNNALDNQALESIWKLKNLKELRLRNCDLDYLPDQLTQLQNLEELYLTGNEIPDLRNNYKNRTMNTIERFCYNMKSLKTLHFSYTTNWEGRITSEYDCKKNMFSWNITEDYR